jgi:hypothetical protein
MIWNSARTSLGENWGTAPSLIEPISGSYTIRLRSDCRFLVYALDAQGNRTKQVGDGVGTIHLQLDTGADRTVWYEIVADQTAVSIGNQPYYLVAKSSGLCLDVQGGAFAIQDGTPVQQWTCWGGDNQKWNLVPSGQGMYGIVSQSSGKAVDVTGGPSAIENGVPLQQWAFWGGSNQLWKLIPIGDAFQLIAASSGLCLDVRGGAAARADGVIVQQWSCLGGSNQAWQLVPATSTTN